MNIYKAILFTLISSLLFAAMAALVRFAGETAPLGQVVFFRAAFGVVPITLLVLFRGQLSQMIRTRRVLGHGGRGLFSVGGMFLHFASLARLPVVDATAFSFVSPLATVVLSAIFLKERVRIYRWSAVILGFVGVLVMLWPHFDPSRYAGFATTATAIGAMCGLAGAIINAGAVIQTRRLTDTETTSSIVFYFSLFCALAGLSTLPFGWIWPTPSQLAALIATGLIGGLSHIFLTESYRNAPQSIVAPFNYTTMLWALVIGYVFFGEVPLPLVLVGASIIAVAGLIVVFRERQLGRRDIDSAPPAA
ncbi:DMT family transporter [Pseudorhodoplanes sp.]|uniref:DMT family transporter n=1 Tax=Pseudorhodoplanes sp. TaxID=1934341 RepID=UPI002BE7E162|nr:DMT family transporter [Pseudorhodoplanes sp.]HWV41394.1 DMT family transporter [Pseudorhodoplanes sp.]